MGPKSRFWCSLTIAALVSFVVSIVNQLTGHPLAEIVYYWLNSYFYNTSDTLDMVVVALLAGVLPALIGVLSYLASQKMIMLLTPGRCHGCGYRKSESKSDLCPECGKPWKTAA